MNEYFEYTHSTQHEPNTDCTYQYSIWNVHSTFIIRTNCNR